MEFNNIIFKNGIVGAGGAGFPSHIKYSAKNIDYLIINGAECEPLLEVDKFLIRNKTLKILKAITLIAKETKAKEIYIAIKKIYVTEIEKLKFEISKHSFNIKIFEMDTFYPAGDEQVIVYELTKRTVPELGIPLDVGVIVTNVGTLLNVYEAVNEDKPVIDKYLSIHGEINNPLLLKVPIGTSIKECLKAAGGSKIEKYKIIIGGPLMGKVITSSQIEDITITKTTGALIVLPEDHYIFKRKEKSINHIINEAKSSCIQCMMCTDLCPRFLIGHKLRPHKIMRSVSMCENNPDALMEAVLCCECGVCELYACPMQLSPRMINIHIKDIIKKNNIKFQKNNRILIGNEMRKYRKIPTKRLISRLNLSNYSDFHAGDFALELDIKRVSIPLKQHIGDSANPIVSIGDFVKKGDLIGSIEENQLGSNIHSSISGIIEKIDKNITIQYKEVE